MAGPCASLKDSLGREPLEQGMGGKMQLWKTMSEKRSLLEIKMENNSVTCKPIGIIHSCHVKPENTPIQSVYAEGCAGQTEVFSQYEAGLSDLEGFSHIYLIYHFHKAGPVELKVKPFLEDIERGLFATRSPRRPNPLGLSVVKLIKREKNILFLDGVDILDGTPLLDIKPYTARFDRLETSRNGWQDALDEETVKQRARRGYTDK